MPLFKREPKYTVVKPTRKRDIPGDLWTKCEDCGELIYKKKLEENMMVCPRCKFHFTYGAYERINMIIDPDTFTEYDKDMETLYPYYQLPKGEMRDNYITQNPEVEASLYFWGLKTEVTNPKTWGIVQNKLRQYGISEDSYPIRAPIEEWKSAGKTQEQLYSDLLTATPKYLSDYIEQNKESFQDVTTLVPRLQERKQADQKLIDAYERAMVGADPELREAYRYDHPALDAALNLWGRVKTTQTSKADELLTQVANELGIPVDAIPALSTVGGFGTTAGFGRTVKRTYKRLRR